MVVNYLAAGYHLGDIFSYQILSHQILKGSKSCLMVMSRSQQGTRFFPFIFSPLVIVGFSPNSMNKLRVDVTLRLLNSIDGPKINGCAWQLAGVEGAFFTIQSDFQSRRSWKSVGSSNVSPVKDGQVGHHIRIR